MHHAQDSFEAARQIMQYMKSIPGFQTQLEKGIENLHPGEEQFLNQNYGTRTDSFIGLLAVHFDHETYVSELVQICDPGILAAFYDRFCEIEDYQAIVPQDKPQRMHYGPATWHVRSIFLDFYGEITGSNPQRKFRRLS